jgi:hypothetical protein
MYNLIHDMNSPVHFGKMLGMDEVNFVVFQTYSTVVKYILSTFEELNP